MLRRSGFKRPELERPPRSPLHPLERCGVVRQVGDTVVACPKGIKAKPGKRKANAVEARWMDAIVNHGCVACRLEGHEPRATVPHHIIDGGRRLGHLFTIPLCDPGHHQGGAALGLVSRHPFKARFEAKYGTEFELLAKLKQELVVFDSAEYST